MTAGAVDVLDAAWELSGEAAAEPDIRRYYEETHS